MEKDKQNKNFSLVTLNLIYGIPCVYKVFEILGGTQ